MIDKREAMEFPGNPCTQWISTLFSFSYLSKIDQYLSYSSDLEKPKIGFIIPEWYIVYKNTPMQFVETIK